MQIRFDDGRARIEGVRFDARLTLMDSAQCFCWTERQGVFYAAVFGRPVAIRPAESGLDIWPCDREFLDKMLNYLDLARDYGALKSRYAQYPCALSALDKLDGLRVLNQPVLDTLLSFILSANNNVSRIRSLVSRLCAAYGPAYALDGEKLYGFPDPRALAHVPEQALRALGVGYRAGYLINTARAVDQGFDLEALRNLPYEQAHARLLQLSGVGDQVADCVLLFSCGHHSAFPVDVWVDRLMRCWFEPLRPAKNRKALAQQARAMLGDEAGLLQQYLFHCARCGILPLEERTDTQCEERIAP